MKVIRLFMFFFVGCMPSCSSQTAEQDIILINVNALDRKGIADEINVINDLKPKVVAIDLQFSSDKNYDHDHALFLALEGCKNLVMVSIIEDYSGEDVVYTKGFTLGSLPNFTTNAKTGFANAILEKDELQTLRKFSIVENMDGNNEYHFSVRTAMAYDSLKAMEFVKSNPRIMDIDYQNGKRKFKVFSAKEILDSKIAKESITGKIVMIGFLGPGREDKFFTPLNIDPAEPDMYGLECLANIVAQVLEHK
jgi:CHASE2 domain-containing sensor protein